MFGGSYVLRGTSNWTDLNLFKGPNQVVNQSTTHNIYNTSDLHDAQNFSMSNLQNPIFDANIGLAHFYVEQKK
jgi:hypothetical protein